jgi:hypothetical protein
MHIRILRLPLGELKLAHRETLDFDERRRGWPSFRIGRYFLIWKPARTRSGGPAGPVRKVEVTLPFCLFAANLMLAAAVGIGVVYDAKTPVKEADASASAYHQHPERR